MNFAQEISQAMKYVREACQLNGCYDLADEIVVEFNSRFTRKMGDASYREKRIRLSQPLWPRASAEERKNTIIHEACHLIAFHRYGCEIKAHGREWKVCMKRAGETPSRCHSVDRSGLKRKNAKRPKFLIDCGCQTHTIGDVRAKRIARGERSYKCHVCKKLTRPETLRPA